MVWDRVQNFSIKEIVVDKAAFAATDRWTVVDAISGFAKAAQQYGGLAARELPAAVLWNSQTTLYQTQVGMNGHLGFVGNSGWRPANVDACRRGLAACGADDYLKIFDELVALVGGSGIPGAEWNARRNEVLANTDLAQRLDDLDTGYFALGEDPLLDLRIAWLRTLPHLRAVSPDRVRPTIEALTAGNPLRKERLAVLEQERAEVRQALAREANTRLALDRDTRAMGQSMLRQLRRPFRNDPKTLGPIYEIIAGQGILWPVESRDAAHLMLMPTIGKAALFVNMEAVGKPRPMPDALLEFAKSELATVVVY